MDKKNKLHAYLFLNCVSMLVSNTGYLLQLLSKTEDAYIAALKFSYAHKQKEYKLRYMWADVNMLRSYGCEVPKSYSDMKGTCRILRESGQQPLSIGAKDSWMNLDLWMSIAADCDRDLLYDCIEGRASFESEPMIESFRIWQECFNNRVFLCL